VTFLVLLARTGPDGVGLDKAHIAIHLLNEESGGFLGTSHVVDTDGNQVLRIELDRDDPALPCPSGGGTRLLIHGIDVPDSARSFEGAFRVVQVVVSWETGDDPTSITCAPATGRPGGLGCGSPTRSVAPAARTGGHGKGLLVALREDLERGIQGAARRPNFSPAGRPGLSGPLPGGR
jgi:hypothetical protein